jgi:hypothetical protein
MNSCDFFLVAIFLFSCGRWYESGTTIQEDNQIWSMIKDAMAAFMMVLVKYLHRLDCSAVKDNNECGGSLLPKYYDATPNSKYTML